MAERFSATSPYGPAKVGDAKDLADRTLAATDAPVSERVLASHILGLVGLLVDLDTQADQATPPAPAINKGLCATCGDSYAASTLRKARDWHDEDHTDHPFVIRTSGGYLVVTDNTLREIEHPSGPVARDETGPNDRYGK